jgi:hypothetical protein
MADHQVKTLINNVENVSLIVRARDVRREKVTGHRLVTVPNESVPDPP